MLQGDDSFVIEGEHVGRCLYCGSLAIHFLFSMSQIERNLGFLLLDIQTHVIHRLFQLQSAVTAQQWWQVHLQDLNQLQQLWLLHIY